MVLLTSLRNRLQPTTETRWVASRQGFVGPGENFAITLKHLEYVGTGTSEEEVLFAL